MLKRGFWRRADSWESRFGSFAVRSRWPAAEVLADAVGQYLVVAPPCPKRDWDLGFATMRWISLSRRASAEVGQVVHAQACGDLAKSISACGEEPAQEAAFAEFFDACPPALGAAAQAFEDAASSAEMAALPLRKRRPV